MKQSMINIKTNGISYIEPLNGSRDWYWGMDYTSGDLYEAEELFQQGHPVKQNRLIFIRYPDGKIVEPITAKSGQYLGCPLCYNNKIILLLVDFPAGQIQILQLDDTLEQYSPLANLPLSLVEDCYNLMLKSSPLMLTRQGSDDRFQILWPERIDFPIGNTEVFLFRIDQRLYFSAWYEDPDYREEIIVRKLETGEIVDRFPGSAMLMPDGQIWILQ